MIKIEPKIVEFCATDQGKESAIQFLPILYENIRLIDRRVGRYLLIIAALCLSFELLFRSSIGAISISGVEITEHSVIERLIPPLISYVFFVTWALLMTRRVIEDLYDKIIERVYPSLWIDDLELYLRPPHLIKIYRFFSREAGGLMEKCLDWSIRPIIIVSFFSVIGFLIYASIRILIKFDFPDPLTILSVLFTTFFVGQTFLIGNAQDKVTKETPATPSTR